MGLDGLVAAEVEDGDIFVLAQPMQAANALLDAHGVPGQIIVDELMAELEVAPFGAALGAHHDPHAPQLFAFLPEEAHGLLFLVNVHAAVKADRAYAPLVQLRVRWSPGSGGIR